MAETNTYDTNKAGKLGALKILAQRTDARLDKVETGLSTLTGSDTGKSARAIAAEELAKQLIPENAKESMDTLEELAAWIQAHPDDASAINQSITELKALIGTLPEGATATTVIAYITEAITAAHSNKTVLDGITAEKVAEWDGKASTSTATATTAGLMSAADKTKLDGIDFSTDAEVNAMLDEVYGPAQA